MHVFWSDLVISRTAIQTYENNGIQFVSSSGINSVSSPTPTTSYVPDLPIAQFYQAFSVDAFMSKVTIMQPKSTWQSYDQCVVCTTEPNLQNRVARAMSAKLPYAIGTPGGVFLALAQHDWLSTTTGGGVPNPLNLASDNAARLFFNAVLLPSSRPASCAFNLVSDPNVQTVVTFATSPRFQSLTYTVVVSNTGSSAAGVVATVNIDPTFAYQSYSVSPPDSVTCTFSAPTLTCSQFGSLSGGVYYLAGGQSYTVLSLSSRRSSESLVSRPRSRAPLPTRTLPTTKRARAPPSVTLASPMLSRSRPAPRVLSMARVSPTP